MLAACSRHHKRQLNSQGVRKVWTDGQEAKLALEGSPEHRNPCLHADDLNACACLGAF